MTAKTGQFTGKVLVPGVTKPVTGRGYLPRDGRAWGYFLGITDGGRIQLKVR